ncbi:hypothetical protein FRC08_015980, partial [Ceratobasidium sp. 394]
GEVTIHFSLLESSAQFHPRPGGGHVPVLARSRIRVRARAHTLGLAYDHACVCPPVSLTCMGASALALPVACLPGSAPPRQVRSLFQLPPKHGKIIPALGLVSADRAGSARFVHALELGWKPVLATRLAQCYAHPWLEHVFQRRR